MDTVALLSVPYFLAREREGMGAGPDAILEGGLVPRLAELGWRASTREIRLTRSGLADAGAVAELNASLAEAVRDAIGAGQFPLVLAGDCNASLGCLAGLGDRAMATLWFDAHGDFNTPETSPSGFLDGMCLAIAAGRCHQDLRERVGLQAIQGGRIVHAGGRDFDPQEREALLSAGAVVISPEQLCTPDAIAPVFGAIGKQAEGLYAHVDLDVLDGRRCPVNEFQPHGGLSLDELLAAIRIGARSIRLRAAAITAYNPDCDAERRSIDAAIQVAETICGSARRPPSG